MLMLALRKPGSQELRQGMKTAVQVCIEAKSQAQTIASVNSLSHARFASNQMRNYLLSPA